MSWGASWRVFRGQQLPEPSNAEMVESCVLNAEEASRRESMLRDRIEHCQPGDPRLPEMHCEVTAAVSDQRHWREYAQHYRGEARREGGHWSNREPGDEG